MARVDLGVQTLMYPAPVLIIGTYDKDGKPNAMNAAWGGIYDYNQVMICLSKHKTTENIRLNRCATVAFATKKNIEASDYVGIVSQNKVPNKVEIARLHASKASKVNAPIFEEYPLTLELELKEVINEGQGGGNFIFDIVNVNADSSILDENGKIDIEKVEPVFFDMVTNTYREIGPVFAKAFAIGLAVK